MERSISKVVVRAYGASMAFALALVAHTAHGDDLSTMNAPPPAVDKPTPEDDAARHAIDRTWLYVDDAHVAAPLVFVETSSVSYTSVGNSPSRIVSPFPSCSAPCNSYNSFAGNTATPGGMKMCIRDRHSPSIARSNNPPTRELGTVRSARARSRMLSLDPRDCCSRRRSRAPCKPQNSCTGRGAT